MTRTRITARPTSRPRNRTTGRFAPFIAVLAGFASTACENAGAPTASVEPAVAAKAIAPSVAAEERFIVVFRDGTRDVPGLAARLAAAHGGSISHIYQYSLQGFAAHFPAQALAGLQQNPNVAFVERDQALTIAATQRADSWGLDRIDQRNLPLNTTYAYQRDGSGVRVYVIDTAIRITHHEFGGRATFGFSSVGEPDGSYGCYWHGTQVAGTIGGAIYGVAKQVLLVSVQVVPCQGQAYMSYAIAGVDWVTANHVKPAVANMSLGGGASRALDVAVAKSVGAGVTYVAAAGNDNADACKTSPARAEPAITVGSTTKWDARAPTSNFGSCLDLFAPGDNITSASAWSDSSVKAMSGTSMASPHVAGVAALVLQGKPSANPSEVAQTITSNATKGKVTGIARTPNLLLYSGFRNRGGAD